MSHRYFLKHENCLKVILIYPVHKAICNGRKRFFFSWNGCLILFFPVAVQSLLSIYIHYCCYKNSAGFHYFIGMRSPDSVLFINFDLFLYLLYFQWLEVSKWKWRKIHKILLQQHKTSLTTIKTYAIAVHVCGRVNHALRVCLAVYYPAT